MFRDEEKYEFGSSDLDLKPGDKKPHEIEVNSSIILEEMNDGKNPFKEDLETAIVKGDLSAVRTLLIESQAIMSVSRAQVELHSHLVNATVIAIQCTTRQDRMHRIEVLKLLVEFGAGEDPDINAQAVYKVLCEKFATNSVDIIRVLCRLKINWNYLDYSTKLSDPLIHLALANHFEYIPEFCMAGADIDQLNVKGLTLFHRVVQEDFDVSKMYEILERLFSLKANPVLREPGSNMTPYQIALTMDNYVLARKIADYTRHIEFREPGLALISEPYNTIEAQDDQYLAMYALRSENVPLKLTLSVDCLEIVLLRSKHDLNESSHCRHNIKTHREKMPLATLRPHINIGVLYDERHKSIHSYLDELKSIFRYLDPTRDFYIERADRVQEITVALLGEINEPKLPDIQSPDFHDVMRFYHDQYKNTKLNPNWRLYCARAIFNMFALAMPWRVPITSTHVKSCVEWAEKIAKFDEIDNNFSVTTRHAFTEWLIELYKDLGESEAKLSGKTVDSNNKHIGLAIRCVEIQVEIMQNSQHISAYDVMIGYRKLIIMRDEYLPKDVTLRDQHVKELIRANLNAIQFCSNVPEGKKSLTRFGWSDAEKWECRREVIIAKGFLGKLYARLPMDVGKQPDYKKAAVWLKQASGDRDTYYARIDSELKLPQVHQAMAELAVSRKFKDRVHFFKELKPHSSERSFDHDKKSFESGKRGDVLADSFLKYSLWKKNRSKTHSTRASDAECMAKECLANPSQKN